MGELPRPGALYEFGTPKKGPRFFLMTVRASVENTISTEPTFTFFA